MQARLCIHDSCSRISVSKHAGTLPQVAGVDSFPENIQTMYQNRNETESPWPKYVPGEVIVKFKKEAAEGEIVGLKIGQS